MLRKAKTFLGGHQLHHDPHSCVALLLPLIDESLLSASRDRRGNLDAKVTGCVRG